MVYYNVVKIVIRNKDNRITMHYPVLGCSFVLILHLVVSSSFLRMLFYFADASGRRMDNLQLVTKKFFASINNGEEKPFDFLRILFGMSAEIILIK